MHRGNVSSSDHHWNPQIQMLNKSLKVTINKEKLDIHGLSLNV